MDVAEYHQKPLFHPSASPHINFVELPLVGSPNVVVQLGRNSRGEAAASNIPPQGEVRRGLCLVLIYLYSTNCNDMKKSTKYIPYSSPSIGYSESFKRQVVFEIERGFL
ncbi:MAG TPA: hypothetical protein DCS93_19050, partial [Microscillaceae bacterium]|nr:hypothetical protein [Microscillaceae bacterium]